MSPWGHWGTTTVGAEFDVQLGKMLDARRNVGEKRPYIGNRAVQWGHIDIGATRMVPLTPRDRARFRLQRGDLLVCEGGEVGRAALWNDQLPECYYQKALHRLRPKSTYRASVMAAVLEHLAQTDGFANYVTQTSIAHLPREKLLDLPIPRIPEPAQQRIEKILGDAVLAGDSIKDLIVKKEGIYQGLMQELVTGRTRLAGFDDSWVSCSMGSMGATYGGLTGKSKDDFGSGDALYVPFMAVMSGVRVEPRSLLKVRVAATESQQVVEEGDILFNTSSETPDELALASVAFGLPRPTYLNSFCFGLRPRPDAEIDSVFLAYLFRSEVGRSKLRSLAQGATRYNLSRGRFKQIDVQRPSLPEQQAIVSVLDAADTELATLQRMLAKNRSVKQGLIQQLLTGRTRLPSESEERAA